MAVESRSLYRVRPILARQEIRHVRRDRGRGAVRGRTDGDAARAQGVEGATGGPRHLPERPAARPLIHRHGPRLLHRWGLLERIVASGWPPITARVSDADDSPLVAIEAAVEAGVEFRDGFAVEGFAERAGDLYPGQARTLYAPDERWAALPARGVAARRTAGGAGGPGATVHGGSGPGARANSAPAGGASGHLH